jgi:hypothetical protein
VAITLAVRPNQARGRQRAGRSHCVWERKRAAVPLGDRLESAGRQTKHPGYRFGTGAGVQTALPTALVVDESRYDRAHFRCYCSRGASVAAGAEKTREGGVRGRAVGSRGAPGSVEIQQRSTGAGNSLGSPFPPTHADAKREIRTP